MVNFTMLDTSFKEKLQNHHKLSHYESKRNSIPKVQTEIVKSEDRQNHGQENETKNKYRIYWFPMLDIIKSISGVKLYKSMSK